MSLETVSPGSDLGKVASLTINNFKPTPTQEHTIRLEIGDDEVPDGGTRAWLTVLGG